MPSMSTRQVSSCRGLQERPARMMTAAYFFIVPTVSSSAHSSALCSVFAEDEALLGISPDDSAEQDACFLGLDHNPSFHNLPEPEPTTFDFAAADYHQTLPSALVRPRHVVRNVVAGCLHTLWVCCEWQRSPPSGGFDVSCVAHAHPLLRSALQLRPSCTWQSTLPGPCLMLLQGDADAPTSGYLRALNSLGMDGPAGGGLVDL
jgi:hypothetical protein